MPKKSNTVSALPLRKTGRQSAEAQASYEAELITWCERLVEIQASPDFAVGVRGWCYILEEEIGLGKANFDQAERLITQCRKDGHLPLDFCADDETRAAHGLEVVDEETPEEFADDWLATLANAHKDYNPVSFWGYQDWYVEMAVEKIDLRNLFEPVCA